MTDTLVGVAICALVLFCLMAVVHLYYRFLPVPELKPIGELPTGPDPNLVRPPSNKRVVAVIGGSGMVAGAIVDLLRTKSFDEVVVVDLVKPQERHDIPNLCPITFRQCDISCLDQLLGALHDVTHVVHSTAIVDLREYPIQRAMQHNVTLYGTYNVLRACILLGIKHMVFTSTGMLGVIESGPSHCKDEEMMLKRAREIKTPNITYRHAKIRATQMVLDADKRGGLRTAAIAFHIPYGSLAPTDVATAIANRMFVWEDSDYGDVALAHVQSIAMAHYLALKQLELNPDKVGGQLFMIADMNMNYYDFTERVWEATGPGTVPRQEMLTPVFSAIAAVMNWFFQGQTSYYIAIRFCPNVRWVIRRFVTYGNCTKAKELLGWRPIPLEEGLRMVAETTSLKSL